MALRIDVLRRFWAIDKLRERIDAEGLGAALRFVRANAGQLEDAALARRFAALRALPEGTLGREYIRYLERNGWPLPGEKGALSDVIVFHDMTHVLGDYGTDPRGEVEVACFSAGFRREEPFTFVLFVLLQFHVGLRMTPGAKAEQGYFDVERALTALERGAAMSIDLTSDWNYWDVIDVSVEELRRRYGIRPKSDAAA
jgi:ubiquinone biosynthesis protein Coq4